MEIIQHQSKHREDVFYTIAAREQGQLTVLDGLLSPTLDRLKLNIAKPVDGFRVISNSPGLKIKPFSFPLIVFIRIDRNVPQSLALFRILTEVNPQLADGFKGEIYYYDNVYTHRLASESWQQSDLDRCTCIAAIKSTLTPSLLAEVSPEYTEADKLTDRCTFARNCATQDTVESNTLILCEIPLEKFLLLMFS